MGHAAEGIYIVPLVLVTGAKGFIGRNLSRWLNRHGAQVIGLGHGAINAEQLTQNGLADWVNGDIDHANLQLLARRHGVPDAIYHLAGGSNVGRSVENPLEDFNRTVVTAAHLFEWVRLECPRVAITIASSAAVYGQGYHGPIPEPSKLGPYSPYGAHKAMMEQLAKSYAENYGLRLAACRLFSVYGPGLEKQLIYDLCVKCHRAIALGERQLELFGTGQEIRDWIHVDDVCQLLSLASSQASRDFPIINGGSGEGVAVRTVAEMVQHAFRVPIELVFNGQQRSGDPTSLLADISRAVKLGFAPQVNLSDGISQVVDSFRMGNSPR